MSNSHRTSTRVQLLAGCMLLLLSISACSPSGGREPDPTASPIEAIQASLTETVSPPTSPAATPTPAVELIDYPLPSWTSGPEDALVVLTLYGDYQSTPSRTTQFLLAQLFELHPTELLLEYRHFPLVTVYDKSLIAVLAAEAAGLQGYFWEMHSWLYNQQSVWQSDDPDEFVQRLLDVTAEMGMDSAAFEAAIQDPQLQERVQLTFAHGLQRGLTAVPYIELNQEPFMLSLSLTNLEAVVQLALLEPAQIDTYPPRVLPEEWNGLVHIHLDDGAELTVQLFPESAPLAVNSFLYLAQEGWFDNTGFYSVVPDVQVEGGDPSHTGLGGPGYTFPMEIDGIRTFDEAGMLALVSHGPDANGSAFFITLTSRPELNGTRTIFGRIVSGLEPLQALEARSPLTDILAPLPLRITEMVIDLP